MKYKFYALIGLASVFSLGANGQIISTKVGTGVPGLTGDGGPAAEATLHVPSALALDAAGNLFIADMANNRIRKVNTSGTISTIAGSDSAGFIGDGGPATDARLNSPTGIALDASGNIYIADKGNNKIRKINAAGIISTFAGDVKDTAGFRGDGDTAILARLNHPTGVAVDDSGNVFIADQLNNRIRRVNKLGIIETVIGNGVPAFNGDEHPFNTDIMVNMPYSITFAPNGDLYVADTWNNLVRRVDKTTGKLTTFYAMQADHVYHGSNTMRLFHPTSITFDKLGNMYVADQGNYKIKRIDTFGYWQTMAGTGGIGFSGDGDRADKATFQYINGIVSDDGGNLWVADTYNERVRYITTTVSVSNVTGILGSIELYPNPANSSFNFNLTTEKSQNVAVVITDVTGKVVFSQNMRTNVNNSISLDVPAGLYLLTAVADNQKLNAKLTISK